VDLDRDSAAAEKFLSQNGITFPVVYGGSEAGMKAAASYFFVGAPDTAIIGRDGTVRAHFIGSRPAEFIRGELKKAGIG